MIFITNSVSHISTYNVLCEIFAFKSFYDVEKLSSVLMHYFQTDFPTVLFFYCVRWVWTPNRYSSKLLSKHI